MLALQNAIISVGTSSTDEVRSTFAQYLDENTQALTQDAHVQAIVYIDQTVALNGYQIVVAGSHDDSQYQSLLNEAKTGGYSVYIGDKSVLAVDVSAVNQADQAAIQIAGPDGKAIGKKGKIVVVGINRASELQSLNLFSDAGAGQDDNGSAVEIASPDAGGSDIEVTTLSGLYLATLKAGESYSTVSTVAMELQPEELPDSHPDTSKPTHDAIGDYVEEEVPEGNYNPVLDYTAVFYGSGFSAETVARMGSYGGIAHSALAASDITVQLLPSVLV